jgi:hypothetical protein
MNIDDTRIAFRDVDGTRYDMSRSAVGVSDEFTPDEHDRPVCRVFFNGIMKWVPMPYASMRALLHGNKKPGPPDTVPVHAIGDDQSAI